MSISNASRLADFGSNIGTENSVLQLDNANQRVGIATTNPQGTLQVGTGVTVYGNSGIVSAVSFYGQLVGNADTATSATSATTATTATTATNAQGLTGTPNITVGNVVGSSATFTNLTVNGTQTIINTEVLDVADKNIGIGSTSSPSDALADGSGITIYGTTNKTLTWSNSSDAFTFSNGVDVKGAVESVSVGATYNLGGGRVVLELDAQNGTVFTHNLANGIVGIVSLRDFPATKNSATTFSVIFTQNSAGTANTTARTGIGTNIYLTPYGVAGFTTTSKVATASTVTLSTTALDVDIVTFLVHYNGSGTSTRTNYQVYVSNNSGFRYGTVGF